MVGIATWRLEIRWEPGFLLKTKRGRDCKGKGEETEEDKRRRNRRRGREPMLKQQNKTGEIDLEGRADKTEGRDCWDVERGRVRGKKKIHTQNV